MSIYISYTVCVHVYVGVCLCPAVSCELLYGQSLFGHLLLMLEQQVTELVLQHVQSAHHYRLRFQRTSRLQNPSHTWYILINAQLTSTLMKNLFGFAL